MFRHMRDKYGGRIICPKSITKIISGESDSKAVSRDKFSESLPVRVTGRPKDEALSSTGEGFSFPLLPERVGNPVIILVRAMLCLIRPSRHSEANFPVPINQILALVMLEMPSGVLRYLLLDGRTLQVRKVIYEQLPR